ncbi:acyl-CoA synthetase [Aestuariirhabdus litorea]|uniref:AMP-dependent synthetase n=1 Tax=Aestuariirhabdus litorea TaxID=2528527 RepID=A0A3P3VIV1_9GAMM|nr:acyl-CoA synthetase [Aestuariirhabdus litorea]RRJ82655.1 AMP-dependent synthetase [Aestuariirhabdus litorea]RWW92816.1 AMP-dependent synthetase [Endozoicomonadaceae bacterium GTF-13]
MLSHQPQADYEQLWRDFRWPSSTAYNIGVDVCDRWANSDPERIALIHKLPGGGLEEVSFGQLKERSNRLANLLTRLGIGEGDRVAVLLGQCPETAFSHIAIYKMAAIAVPLFSLFERDALLYRLNDSGCRAVVTDRIGAAKLAAIREQLPALEQVLVVDEVVTDELDLRQAMALESDQFEPVVTGGETPALIIYTSGTTGQPKGALHGHQVLLGHLPGVELSHNFFPQPGDRIWTPADWAWIGGLYDVLLPALHHGVTVVAHRMPKFDPEGALQLIADFEIRNLFMPPTALKLLRTLGEIRGRWALSLRTIASGGEPLGEELLQWAEQQLGVRINEFYGQTECNMIVSNCEALMPIRAGSMGRPAPGHRLAVVDPEGQPLGVGEVGVVAVKRPDPVMFLGYWNNEPATRARFVGDWMLTGDLAYQDAQGYLYFQARDDDLITSAGYRFGPGEIENCLLSHPAVRMVAVVGKADPLRTQIVKAFVVLNRGYSGDTELVSALQAHVKTRLAPHEYPREVAFVESLPMTVTGKIIRRALRE